MGLVIRDDSQGTVHFFLKGADSTMVQLIDEATGSFVQETCDDLARQGLRTLVFSSKVLQMEEYENWKTKLEQASSDIEHREEREHEAIKELEANMQLICVTGVEDLLQDDIKVVIENLRAAGIRVWMLTGMTLVTLGDKLETAKCIAISAGLKSKDQGFIELANVKDKRQFIADLRKIEQEPDSVLVIEGDMIAEVLADPTLVKEFVKYSAKASSVVCCRCAPTQKAELVKAIKNNLDKVIACIGDGGNDVAMIQKADVGIGIEGKEGNQASLASDFSITEFKTLAPLLLWTGRLSYIRTALLSNFVIHRGMIISVIQFLFTCMFGYHTIPIYNGYLLLGYATIFTSIPVFSLIFDEDVTYEQVQEYPELYRLLQQGSELSIATFLGWAWMSIFQGTVIIVLAVVLFTTSFLELVTITFTALIFIEMLNIVTSVRKWHPMIVLGVLTSIAIYTVCLVFLRHWFLLEEIHSEFFARVLLIVAAAWVPVFLSKLIGKWIWPSPLDKMRAASRVPIRKQGYLGRNQERLLEESEFDQT